MYFNNNKNLIVFVNHALIRFLSQSVCLVSTNYHIHHQKYFIYYYIDNFQPRGNFFDILLVLVSFLQTYYDICFFHILSFCFFLIQISFCIYLLLAVLIFLYCSDNLLLFLNLLLYLVSHLCFFDNKFSHSFFIYSKKNYKTPFLSIKLELFIMLIASSLLIYQK